MITDTVGGITLRFETNEDCFSPQHLDKGTLFMLSRITFGAEDKVLDLGCGYGTVGIFAAKTALPQNVYMTDINPQALLCARKNAELNGVTQVHIIESDAYDGLAETGFDLIISNPPYHTDFSVAKRFIEKGFNRLKIGGRMFMVTKRREWYKNKLISVFGGVRIYEQDGYFVFEAQKRGASYANAPHAHGKIKKADPS